MKISKSSRLARFHIRKVDSIYNIPVSPEEAGFSKWKATDKDYKSMVRIKK